MASVDQLRAQAAIEREAIVNGKRQSKVVLRPREDWIEVAGACPRIVEENLWQRVQEILNDPERTKQRPTPRFYILRGRAKCGICGSAMVGQTLMVKKRSYRYYGCRHIYDNNLVRHCSARYVRGNSLEDAVWQEVKRALTDPTVVLQELETRAKTAIDHDEIAKLHGELDSLRERGKRLVKLYSLGTIDENLIRQESEEISRKQIDLEKILKSFREPDVLEAQKIDRRSYENVCSRIASWLDTAENSDRVLALEALQVNITATPESVTVRGILPLEGSEFITNDRTSPCS